MYERQAAEIDELLQRAAGVVDSHGHLHAGKGLGVLSGRFISKMFGGGSAGPRTPTTKLKPVGKGNGFEVPAHWHSPSSPEFRALVDRVITPSGIGRDHWRLVADDIEDDREIAVIVGPNSYGRGMLYVKPSHADGGGVNGWRWQEAPEIQRGDYATWRPAHITDSARPGPAGSDSGSEPVSDEAMAEKIRSFVAVDEA